MIRKVEKHHKYQNEEHVLEHNHNIKQKAEHWDLKELIEEERPQLKEHYNPHKRTFEDAPGPAFHEKSEKNQKENLGGSYQRIIAKKYKKPQTRGDKNYNRRNKK